MGDVDRLDDRVFNANFTADGVVKLRERVMDKLTEFMGDYTDDTLVEYVIVLLRNGRHKEAARNELNVFLGDDSDAFVSWLWDHLASNLDLYVQPKELLDEAPKRKLSSEIQAVDDISRHSYLQSERGKSSKLSRSRHNKDWKGLAREGAEVPPLRSSEVENIHLDERTQHKVNHGPRSRSPPPARRKRGQPDEQLKTKRDAVSKATMNAPRRLLQFAVRDAVATSGLSNSVTPVEPSLKRLRSVVSTPSGNSSLVKPQMIQPVSRVQNPMATVINAVADAAEDVMEIKPSRSVFDRLGRDINSLDVSNRLEDNYRIQEQNQSLYHQRSDYSGQYAANMTSLEHLEHEGAFASDSTSDNEGYDDVNVMGRTVIGASEIGFSSGNRRDNSLVQYNVAKNADTSVPVKPNRVQEQAAAVPNTSNKIVNIPVIVNTRKPLSFQEPREVAEVSGHKTLVNETGAPRSGLQLMKDNAKHVKISNGNENHPAYNQKVPQKTQLTSGSGAAGRPLEDADSRTIFVSNVHFAATKDSLSRHFNKFGEVLKVILVTDAATGQPKGSAYVEFMRKEAADNALSLDGTSFMSRILKIVKKAAAQVDSSPSTAWPRTGRGSPLPPARFSRAPFPRGFPTFRPWPPIKPGARSMQWKRDAQGTPSDNGTSLNSSSFTVPAPRSLTYVRTESKAEGSLGTT
ncbi:Embryonic polyadenylate-binding protein 2 [Senna tora]|uniref:Embryonic polyadenylate-binding protein 2 n=1 Tax=Senna tora TaxID=362788 RepID=A0A835C9Z5_9FABA|nr:Embryonic polyadenylate-binding protein 2 [Senna tora]